jgi:hypothetical protein
LESESVSLEELKKTGTGSENITKMSVIWQCKTTPYDLISMVLFIVILRTTPSPSATLSFLYTTIPAGFSFQFLPC